MIRGVLAVATITAITIGVSAAIAQEDPIKTRKALMKENGDQAKIGAAMVKGDKPFDLAAVHKIFATFEDAAAKMPALFPDSSKSEANSPEADDFSPTPKVWEDMADFKARFVKFGEDAKAAAASVKDLDSFKAASAISARTIAAPATSNIAPKRAERDRTRAAVRKDVPRFGIL